VELMGAVEVVDGVGHERLLEAVEASREAWEATYGALRAVVPRVPVSLGEVGRATAAVSLAARGVSDVEQLSGFLATGFAGNLAAALAVTPREARAGSALVAAAVRLEQRSDLATTVTPRPRVAALARESVSVSQGVVFSPATVTAPEPAAGVSRTSPALVSGRGWPRVEDHAALGELARQRDAGVLAAAARSGVPEAAGLLAGVSRGDVDGLIERGAAARAAIVASGLAAVLHWTGRIPPGMRQARDEFVGEASLRMAEIVDRWDPRRATWGSFAYQEARYAYLENIRRRVQVREVVSERIGDFASGLERVMGPVSVPPEELLVLAEERARVAGLVDQLPGRLREVMVGRLGLAGREKTLAEIGTELGLSESTVHRDEAVGTRLLQQSHLATADQASVSSAVLLRQLAQALQPPLATSEVTVRQEQLRGRHVGRSRPVAR